MRGIDVLATAIGNTFRSKTRTILTILAIFVGAFTLTITNGLGTGIKQYIDSTVSSLGAGDAMTVTKQTAESGSGSQSGPREYEPDTVQTGPGPGSAGGTVAVITQDDIETLAGIDGVVDAEPVRSVALDYVQVGDGTKYAVSASSLVPGQTVQLATGSAPADGSTYELAVPESYVEPLGFSSDREAVGATVTLSLTDGAGAAQTVEAEIVGVSEASFSLGSGDAITLNDALSTALYEAQQIGVAADRQGQYTQARVWFAEGSSDAQVTALQDRLDRAGFDATTVQEQLGAFTTVIDGIVLVLNAFAIIALLAASFGIVNTLLMSVQERTREIGLMKAMGMGSARVFGLFSLEATFIGFLGSAIGVGIAMLAGTALSGVLAGSLLADLPGLQLIAFDPATIAVTVLAVMAIAFLAGTLPAARAARADPVESLRYE